MLARLGARALGGLRHGVEGLLVVVFVVMMAAVLVQVVGRFIHSFTFVGTEEIANFAQVWMVLLGAGVAMRYGRHAVVDVLITLMPVPVARVVYILITAGCLWFLYIVFVGSLPLVDMGFFERSPALQLPMWTMYLSVSVGAVYLAIEMVMWTIGRWRDPYGTSQARED